MNAPVQTPLLSIAFKPNVESDINVARQEDGTFKADQTVKVLTAQNDHAAGTINAQTGLREAVQERLD